MTTMASKNPDPAKMTLEKFKNELQRFKTNEIKLRDQICDMKYKLTALEKVEITLKKEQLEVNRLQTKVADFEMLNNRQKKDLAKLKTMVKDEKFQRAHEKNILDQKILDAERECLEYKDKYDVEKKLGEQRDKEMEKFHKLEEENKALIVRKKTLHNQIDELKLFKSCSLNKIDELTQKLNQCEEALKNTRQELYDLKAKEIVYKGKERELKTCSEKLESTHKEHLRTLKELEKFQKEAESGKGEILWLKHRIEKFNKKSDSDAVSIKTLEHKILTQGEAIKCYKEDSERAEKENARLHGVIEKMNIKLGSHEDLKRKLQKQQDKTAGLISSGDSEVIKLRSMLDELESRYKQQKLMLMKTVAEKDIISENLTEAQEEIISSNHKLQEMYNKIRELTYEINAKDSDLVRISQQYNSVTTKVTKLEWKFTDLRKTEENGRVSADKQKIMAEKSFLQLEAENDQLAKKVVLYNEQLIHQKHKINALQFERFSLEQLLRACEHQVRTFRRQNQDYRERSDLQFKWLAKQLNRCDVTKHSLFEGPPPQVRLVASLQDKLLLYDDVLEKKDKEISSLKLDVGYNTALKLKLTQAQWDNRDLRKRFLASKSLNLTYNTRDRNLMEDNKRLSADMTKLKVDFWKKLKDAYLPTITRSKSADNTEKKTDFYSEGINVKKYSL